MRESKKYLFPISSSLINQPDKFCFLLLLCHPLTPDGEMFTASQYEFRSSPDIRRNFPFPTLRTEEAPTRWLLGERRTRKVGLWWTSPDNESPVFRHVLT